MAPQPQNRKSTLRSKTIGFNALGALGLIWPGSGQWIAGHPRQAVLGLVGMNIILRFFTHQKIGIMMPERLKSQFSYLFPMLLLFCLCMVNCSNFPMDRALSADKGNDYVVVISGYGQASKKGFLFLQANEKAETNKPVTLAFPKVDCKRESCIRYQFFRKDGSAGYPGALKKGETTSQLPLSYILGHEGGLAAADEGEYSVIAQVFFTGNDGEEYSMFGNGFVRVNVLAEAFRPVACNDPNIAWKIKAGTDCEAQFTSVYRTVLCGKGCE